MYDAIRDQHFTARARLARQVYSYLAQGKTIFDVCELLAPDFDGHPWAVYDAIFHICDFEKAKKAYAKAYLIKALYDNGFTFSKISKIAGYSRQYCHQIIKKAV